MTLQNAHARLAARQHHVISTEQLLGLGYSKDAIEWMVDSKRLFPVFRNVYAVGRPDVTREGRWMAAVLACSDRAALSHRSAAVLHRLLEHEGPRIEVIVRTGCSAKRREIHVRRSSDITEEEIDDVDAIRVTSVLRTLIDLSRSGLPSLPLNAAVRQASRIHRTDLQQLRGYRRLDPIVRLLDPLLELTESELEALFLEMCARYRMPRPAPQVKFKRRRADFVFEDARLVIECDSREWHDNDWAYLDDRRKERELKARGYHLLRFTWAEVRYEPATRSCGNQGRDREACAFWRVITLQMAQPGVRRSLRGAAW